MATRKELKAARRAALQGMAMLGTKNVLSRDEKDQFDILEASYKEANRHLSNRNYAKSPGKRPARPVIDIISDPAGKKRNREIQGDPGEILSADQSMLEWLRRASENKAFMPRPDGTRAYFQYADEQRMHDWVNHKLGRETGLSTRALGEDTAGSGQAATPQSWQASYIDYLYPMTLLGRAGMSKFAMATELVNKPQLAAPVSPQWISENSPAGIDATPALSRPLVFSAMGGFKDIQLWSREFMQDALLTGGVAGMLQESASRAYALAVDNAGLYGVSGNVGNPGLFQETGVVNRFFTGDSGSGKAPADYTEFSIVAEVIENTNVSIDNPAERVAILSNPSVRFTFDRLIAPTYAKWFEPSPKLEDLCNNRWFTSTTLTKTETDNYGGGTATEPAATGGSLSSFVMGPFARMIMGVRLDTESLQLDQRYIDYGQVGMWFMARFSIRASHPETFIRTGSIITT